jgi:hypothetical protein
MPMVPLLYVRDLGRITQCLRFNASSTGDLKTGKYTTPEYKTQRSLFERSGYAPHSNFPEYLLVRHRGPSNRASPNVKGGLVWYVCHFVSMEACFDVTVCGIVSEQ